MTASYNTGSTGGLNNVDQATPFTFPIPAGVAVDDVMIVAVDTFSYPQTTPGVSTPTSGGGSWSPIGTMQVEQDGTAGVYATAWFRVATLADLGSTFTMSWNGSVGTDSFWWAATLDSWTGFWTADPIAQFAQTGGITATAGPCPTLTTLRAGSWAVYLGPISPNFGGTITGVPSGSTQRELLNGGQGVNVASASSAGSVGAAGTSIGGSAFTFTPGSSENWWSEWTIELATVSSGGGGASVSGATAGVTVAAPMGNVIAFAGTDGSNITTYNVASPANETGSAGPQTIRVLTPTSPSSNYPHSFVWTLPVEPGQGTTFGDPIATVLGLGAHNQYNVTFIQPGFPVDPWYADNPIDPLTQQETFMKELVAWASTALHVSGPTEVHNLIGFSKSGMGGQDLILRNPTMFGKVASWDFPGSDTTAYDRFSTSSAEVYGTNANFQDNYELTQAHLTTWKNASNFGSVNRIWMGGVASFAQDLTDYDALLTTVGIQHTFTWNVNESHAWHSDWVGAGLAWMYPPATVAGPVALITVAAPVGVAGSFIGTQVEVRLTMQFQAYTGVTASATMEFEAGQPVQGEGLSLAHDPRTSMYPG